MTTEIATREEQPQNLLAVIARAASSNEIDVAKMQALLTMQRDVEDREAQREFTVAKIALQNDLPSIGKRGAIRNKNGAVQSTYSKWEDIDRVIRPLLQRHGFALSFQIETVEGMTAVQAVLSHVGGHVERSGFMRMPADTTGAKNGVQGVGSVMSYGKRYTTIAILNIVCEGEDDDGQTASARAQEFSDIGAEGEKHAKRGIPDYRDWFETLDKERRRLLVESGEHDRLKAIAAANDFPGDRP